VVYGISAALLLFTSRRSRHWLPNAIFDGLGVADRLGSTMVGTMFGLAFHPLTARTERVLRKLGAKHSSMTERSSYRSEPDQASLPR
jgi:hypothetical protein